MLIAMPHWRTDQANNQPRPDITEFVSAIALVLAKTFEKVRHLKKAGDLTCSLLLSLAFCPGSRSKARTSIISKNESTHRYQDTHGQRWHAQKLDR